MKNRIYYVSSKEIEKIKKELEKEVSIFIAEIKGNKIKNLQDYFDYMNYTFKFPIVAQSFNGYFDWIRDLDWLNKECYTIIIYNFNEFMKDDYKTKNEIITDFEKIILPWWEEEVERCVVEGKAKPFNVYLVD